METTCSMYANFKEATIKKKTEKRKDWKSIQKMRLIEDQ